MTSSHLVFAKSHIENINFSPLLDKLTRDDILRPFSTRWSVEQAQDSITNYKKYLYILVKYHEQFEFIPPTLDIDEIWHNHILDTEKYIADCQALFGHYFHHYPYFGIDDNQVFGKNSCIPETFKITQRLFLIEFGELLDCHQGLVASEAQKIS